MRLEDDGSGSPGSLILANAVAASTAAQHRVCCALISPTFMSLSMDSQYHLTVQGDSAYKNKLQQRRDGELKVGIDTTTLGYSPAETASGFVRLNSVNPRP